MYKFQKTTLALSMMFGLLATSEAASLGQLTVTSQINQNFQATFLVHDVTPNGVSLTARLAPEEVYRQYKLAMPESAKGLSLALVNKNPLTLKITSQTPAKERAFPLLVELNEGGQKTIRQYNIHLGATGTVEPVPVAIVHKEESKASIDSIIKEPKAIAQVQTSQFSDKKGTDQVPQTPLQRMQAQNYDLDHPLVVQHGYTPWSLGVLYQKRYPQASINQVLVALAVENPQAFPTGTVNQLKTGAQLRAPAESLVMSIDRKVAQEIVQKGLKIEDVAKQPKPIPEIKSESVAKSETISEVAVKPKETEPIPEVQKEPSLVEKAEKTPSLPESMIAQEVKKTDSIQQEPKMRNGIPVAQAPYHDGTSQAVSAVDEKAPTLPQEPIAQTTEVSETQSTQEPMPTLEIMTEDEVVVEEESTSWLWYVLILALLGGAAFLYWNTKQGGRVNLNALKSLMNSKVSSVRREPTATENIRVEPQVSSAKPSESDFKGQTLQEVIPQVKESTESKVEPVTQILTKETSINASVKSQEEESTNIFDLVGEDTSKELSSTISSKHLMQGQSMKDSLDMARSFIAIGAKKEAFDLLQQVLEQGTPEEKSKAEIFIKQIREQQK